MYHDRGHIFPGLQEIACIGIIAFLSSSLAEERIIEMSIWPSMVSQTYISFSFQIGGEESHILPVVLLLRGGGRDSLRQSRDTQAASPSS